MEEQSEKYLFEEMPVPRAVATLAIPTIISQVVTMIYNLADTFFVGMLNDPIQNAAVALAAPILLAFNAVNNLFGVGSSSMMSRAMGRKDFDTVRKSSAFGFYCAVGGGLLISLICGVFEVPILTLMGAEESTYEATAGYVLWTVTFGAAPSILNVVMAYMVRAEGNALHASIGTMSGCFLNIILDPIFILPWGLNMGAAGAGLATMISNCAACAYFFVLLFIRRKDTNISFSPRHFTLKKEIVLGVFGVGLPASIQNLLNVTGMTILNNFTAAFGADAIAAMGITQKIYMVPMNVSSGISQGVMPLVGYNYASGNTQRMKKTVTLSAKIILAFMVIVTLFFYVFAGGLVELFMSNPSIIEYGTRFMRGFCLGLPFLSMDFLAVGVFQAVGMGKYSLCFAILRKVVLEIPALYILNFLFPLYGLAYAQFAAEIVLAAAAVIILARIFRQMEKTKRF